MTQMPSVRKIQAHQSLMWSHQCLVDLQIGRAATQALHIDPPLLRIQAECLERASLAGQLNGVDMLVATIVSSTRVAFGVFVGHGRAKGIENGTGCKVLGGNEDDGFTLALDFLFLNQVGQSSTLDNSSGKNQQGVYHNLCNFGVCFDQGLLHDLHVD